MVSSTTKPRSSMKDREFSINGRLVQCLLPQLSFSHPASSATFADQHDHDDDPDVLPFASHPAIRQAQLECASLENGNAIAILEDEDVKEDVVQLLGADAELNFPQRSIYRYLVVFLKDLDRFVECFVDLLDSKQEFRRLHLTNARSLAKIDATTCQLPLVLGRTPGWRYLCLDLLDLTQRVFGTKYIATTHVRLRGHCRVLRMFFQDERYADSELPPCLTFLGA